MLAHMQKKPKQQLLSSEKFSKKEIDSFRESMLSTLALIEQFIKLNKLRLKK